MNRPPWKCWLCAWLVQQKTEQKALGNRALSPVYVSHELSSVRWRNVRDTFKLKKDLSNFNLRWIAHTPLEGKKLLSLSSFNQNHKVIIQKGSPVCFQESLLKINQFLRVIFLDRSLKIFHQYSVLFFTYESISKTLVFSNFLALTGKMPALSLPMSYPGSQAVFLNRSLKGQSC